MASSDEEDSQRLREALDPEFMNNSLFNKTAGEKPPAKTQPPSLRPKHDTNHQFNYLHVTPQFQEHVAKKLSAILDDYLEKRLVDVQTEFVKKKRKSYVKLLKNSEKYLKLRKEKEFVKKKMKQAEDSDEDDAKYKEAAVDPVDIINKSEVKNWSTRTKGKVFCYQPSADGLLTLIN